MSNAHVVVDPSPVVVPQLLPPKRRLDKAPHGESEALGAFTSQQPVLCFEEGLFCGPRGVDWVFWKRTLFGLEDLGGTGKLWKKLPVPLNLLGAGQGFGGLGDNIRWYEMGRLLPYLPWRAPCVS